MLKVKMTQNEFWENEEIEGIIFDDDVKTVEDISEEGTFFKDVNGWGSGFIRNNSYSHSNGNFPFWSEGQVIEFYRIGNYIKRSD